MAKFSRSSQLGEDVQSLAAVHLAATSPSCNVNNLVPSCCQTVIFPQLMLRCLHVCQHKTCALMSVSSKDFVASDALIFERCYVFPGAVPA